MSTISISAIVALREEQHLAEHYRNRNLVNAQTAFDVDELNAALKAQADAQAQEIERLRAQIAATDVIDGEE